MEHVPKPAEVKAQNESVDGCAARNAREACQRRPPKPRIAQVSEFLGEARVVIRPDTTRFRAELVAQVTAAARGVVVPVTIAASATSQAATAAAAQLAGATTTATAAINAETVALQRQGVAMAQSTAATTAASRSQQDFQRGIVASAASLTGLRGAVLSASSPFLIAAVSAGAFGAAVRSAASLETELNVFRVTAGATADQMERVGEEAKLLGRDLTLPGVTAQDAAQSFRVLSQAGLSVQDSIAGARGVLQLAVAAEIGFADAAQLAASALNAFGLAGEEAVTVADQLTNASLASQQSISDMGIALRQSAAIADLVGFSLSETVTFLTQLARAGLSGSDAGTSFRVSLQRLIAPTAAARKELGALNINLRDATGNLRPEAFFELGDALEGMSRAQADATRQVIFGNDASRAAAFFARLNADSFRDLEREITRAGSAAEVAGARNAGFAGSIENLKNQLTALGIEIGELALPALGGAADAAALFFGALATQISDSRDALAGFGEDADLLAEALGQVSDDSGFTDFLSDVGSGARLIQGDLERLDAAILGLAGAGDAAEAAAPKITRLTAEEKALAEATTDAHDRTQVHAAGLRELATAADTAGNAVGRLANQQRGLAEQTTRARIADDEAGVLSSLQQQRENLEAELAAQEAIIARPGQTGDATAREAVRQRILPQLEAVNSEIENILAAQQSEQQALQRDRENAQQDLIRARNDADRAFLDTLGTRRDDAGRRASAAAETEGVADDIRAQDRIQALIKQQITKVRARIADEQTRKAAIRELRLALISSRQEEDALRAQQRADVAARREEGISLDIAFAETTGNVQREIAARQRLITLLKKQQAAVKKGTNEWKSPA